MSSSESSWDGTFARISEVSNAPELEPEKMYLRIPTNVQNMEKQEMRKRSIHERLEEKKIVEQ